MERYQAFMLPLQPAPRAIQEACQRGVVQGPVPPLRQALQVLGQPEPCADEVRRAEDGQVLVSCTTDMPGVTPAMVDWWFGWHLPETARYRLWHPKAHVRCRVKEDRSALSGDRARYIGNVSLVDEYIGPSLKKLAIAFHPPADFGFPDDEAARSTTICAATSDRVLKGHGGYLVHHVVKTAEGAQMRSGFWLGRISHQLGLVNVLAGPWLNTPRMRRVLVPDTMVLDLLMHCGEEMNHLARFLPGLHAVHGRD